MHTALRDSDPAVVMIHNPRHAFRRETSRPGMECQLVAVVVSDTPTRAELSERLAGQQIEVRAFASAASCIESVRTRSSLRLIVDFELPDPGGLDLQQGIAISLNLPIILVSGACDIRSVVHAMKSCALEFLAKPVDAEALLSSVHAAFAQQQRARSRHSEILETRYSQLSPRAREVFALVAGGAQNRQAAFILGVAIITLQIHRNNVMRRCKLARSRTRCGWRSVFASDLPLGITSNTSLTQRPRAVKILRGAEVWQSGFEPCSNRAAYCS